MSDWMSDWMERREILAEQNLDQHGLFRLGFTAGRSDALAEAQVLANALLAIKNNTEDTNLKDFVEIALEQWARVTK